MKQLTDNHYVVERLTELWDFHPKANACVLAGRVAQEVLSYFGVPHTVVPMQAVAVNDLMLAHIDDNIADPSLWNPKAWSVGVGFENMVATHRDLRDNAGFDGHLVVMTRTHYIDLTVGQFDRPNHGIVSGGPLAVPLTDLSSRTLNGFGDARFLQVNLNEGFLFMRTIKTDSYRMGKDWRVNYTNIAGPMIRTIKNELKNIQQ